MKIPVIKLKRALLRPLKLTDAESITRNANNKNIAWNLTDRFPYPYKIADAKKWIKKNLSKKMDERTFAVVIDDLAVGAISITRNNEHSGVIGYWLGEKYWGRGIMTEVVRAIVQHAFKDKKIIRISANIHTDNPGSKRVIERAGFKREGVLKKHAKRFGKYKDVYVYAKVR